MPIYPTPVQVTGVLMAGHTTSGQDAPVIIDLAAALRPDQAAFADLRCRSCDAQTTIGRLGADTLAVVEHELRCPELAAIALRAGVTA